jgi:hypothetical protein
MFGSPRLPVAGAHVTPLEGGSSVGGHGDVFSGGSPWTVTGPLPDLLVLLVSLVHLLGPRSTLFTLHCLVGPLGDTPMTGMFSAGVNPREQG